MATRLDRTYEVITMIGQATTGLGLWDALTGFTRRYGLTSMIAATIPPPNELRKAEQKSHLLVSAYPPGWTERYLSQNYLRIDPVAHRAQRDFSPFSWSEAASFAGQDHGGLVKRMFGEAGEFNLKAGIAVPMITPDGLIAIVSLAGETAAVPRDILGMIAMLSTFAVGRAIELRNQEIRRGAARLTAREIECLRWAAEGKNEWEISAILNISECTADKHLAHARRKLRAANRAQAVALAIRLGFIR